MGEENIIPKHWEISKLKEVADYYNGRAIKPSEWEKSGIPIVRIQNLNKPDADYNYSNQCYEERYKIEKGELLYAWSASLGAFIWVGGTAWLNQHIFKVIPRKICDKKFLFYTLEKITGELYSKTHGSGMVHVTKGKFEETKILLPPLHEQQSIVSKIEELFSDLENGRQQLLTAQQQLKIYRQSLLKSAFEGRLNNGNVQDGKLPKGWRLVKISEICNVVRGGSPRPAGDPKFYNGNIPFLKVRDITKNRDTYLTNFEYTIKKAGLNKTRQITPNTLLLSNSGATLGVPKICMINATINDGIAAFLDLDLRSNLYLYYFWMSKTEELRNINMGAAQPNLNTDLIKNYLLPWCSYEEQKQIVDGLESKLTFCDKIEETISQSIQQAETLKQSILKKAFEGKLV